MANWSFAVSGSGITVAASNPLTLVFINPGSSVGIRVLRAWCSQAGSSLTSQNLGIQFSTQVTAFPTLTSATPAKLQRQNPNASTIAGGTAGAAGTSGINASAEGAGAKTVVWADAFNNINGWVYMPTPKNVIEVPAGSSSGLGLVLTTTAGTTSGWNFGVGFEEI